MYEKTLVYAALQIAYSFQLPCDAMHECGHCCHPVSVCPSITLVYCIHMAEDINKRVSQPSSPIILVF